MSGPEPEAQPQSETKRAKGWGQIRRMGPFVRPYLWFFVFTVGFSLLSAAGELGQAYLIKPLFNDVLLQGTDSEASQRDAELTAQWTDEDLARGPQLAQAAIAALGTRAETWATDAGQLRRDFGGRTIDLATWGTRSRRQLGELLERSRRTLELVAARIERVGGRPDLDASSRAGVDEARGLLDRALRAQLLAQEHALRALELRQAEAAPEQRRGLDPELKATAASLSLHSRALARQASFRLAWTQTLFWILVAAVGLALLLGVGRFGASVLVRIVMARVYRDLQVALLAKVVTLPAGELLEKRRGDLLARLTQDLARAVNGVLLPLTTDLMLEPLRLLLFLVGAFYLQWQLALGLVLLGLSVLYPIRRFGKRIRRSGRKRQDALGEVLEAMHQMFAGVRVVKAFRREEHEQERFRRLTEEAYQADVSVAAARAASRTWLRLVNDISIPLVVFGGGYLIVAGSADLSVGTFAAFTGLIVLMYRPTKTLAMGYNTIQDNLTALHRMFAVLDLRPAQVAEPDAQPLQRFEREISAEGVYFRYGADEGNGWVLKDVSFNAPRGTTTAFVGRTGAGKSTLMDLLVRFLVPQQGQLLVDGQPLTSLTLESWLDKLALVGQQPFAFNAAVRDNIRYGRLDASDAEVEEAARRAQLHEEILELPGGYDYEVGELGSKLSGGQLQRLTIARAILRQPEILLLDEATGSLDSRTERQVQEALAELGKQATTFVIAHRLSTVQHADQILVLVEGRIVERGTHAELLAQGGVYAELVRDLEGGGDEARAQ